jgi:hypothetical protein
VCGGGADAQTATTPPAPCRSVQIGITNGNTPDGRDHAGASSTSFRSDARDAAGNAIGGDCAGKHGGTGSCSQRCEREILVFIGTCSDNHCTRECIHKK